MAEYEIDFGFGMTQVFGKRSPAPGSLAGAAGPISTPAASPMTATTGGSPAAPSGYISDMADPDRYRKMADSLRQDWLSRTAPAGSVNGGSGLLPSPVPTMNAYGNDMTQANRFSAIADSMKRDRQAYSAPSGSLAGSMALGDTGQLPAFGSSPATTISAPATVTNSFGNDMTEANRMNAGANAMRQSRLGTPAPGSLAGNLTLNRPTERTDNRTWGDLNQMPAFRPVENVGAMGGNF